MEIGLLVVGAPALVGIAVIEHWRRQAVREWQRLERRRSRRSDAWDAVRELDRAA